MATTQELLESLKRDKQNLVSMLNSMGVEASNNETFTSLTPKVGKIVSDPILQDKSIEITENGTQTIKADSGYNGLNNVTVTTNIASSGGDTTSEDGLITRTLTEYSNSRVTSIGNYGFYNFTALTNVNLPKVTTMGTYAFSSSTKLISAELPLVENVSDRAFYGCTKLSEANFQKATTISTYAFYNCSQLTTLNVPLVKSIGDNAFQNCTNLATVNLNSVQTIGKYCFSGCSKIKKIDLPVCTQILTYGFQGCNLLSTLILRSSTLCTLGTYAITSTSPIGKGTGYVYVPKALIEDYKVATNWSAYANQFRAIEDYPEICG